MSLVVTDAIVLHAFDYLESSRIVRLLTRAMGVQSVLARGARRPRSRFGTALDLFAEGVAQLHVRPGRELNTLSAFDTVRTHSPLAFDLERFTAASALAELALRFGHEESHGEGLFVLISRSFEQLASAPAERARDVGIGSAWRLVGELGFAPTVDSCSLCHAALERDDAAVFTHAGGGIVCGRCARTTPVGRSLPSSARAALRTWLAGDEVELTADAERRAHVRLLREFLTHHLSEEGQLRAFQAWERGTLRSA
jgi:DNA repair protein RecO (recombination protein O)